MRQGHEVGYARAGRMVIGKLFLRWSGRLPRCVVIFDR
jgi:hypothetical protein